MINFNISYFAETKLSVMRYASVRSNEIMSSYCVKLLGAYFDHN